MRMRESEQRTIILLSSLVLLVGFVIPGLDFRSDGRICRSLSFWRRTDWFSSGISYSS